MTSHPLWPNARYAHFHLDPGLHETSECRTRQCAEDHPHSWLVVGEHRKDRFECPHMVTELVSHELSPTDHPANPMPTCPGGTIVVGKRWLPRRWRKTIHTKACETIKVTQVG